MESWNYHAPLKRIADALERIAKALEESNEKSGLLGQEKARTTATIPEHIIYPYPPV